MNNSGASFNSDLRLSAYPQIDENKYPDIYSDLANVHAALRVLQQYLDAYTGAKFIGKAAAAINQGQFVAIGTGDPNVPVISLANASNYLLPCIGFAASGASAGQGIDIQTFGVWPYGNGSLVPGTVYYLNTTSGGITNTAPVGAGKLVQRIGVAVSTSNILFRPSSKYTEL